MIDLSTFGLFLLAVTVLLASPGPNMAFVLSHGAAHGWRGGFAAALGIGAADLLHSLFAASGMTAVIAAWPHSFDIIRSLGAIYLLWLAVQAFRSGGTTMAHAVAQTSKWRIFRMAMLNCLLNPKALLFFMVFLPQFADARRGSVPLQMLTLGLTLAVIATLFNTLLGAGSARVSALFQRPGSNRWPSLLLGSVLLGLAARLLLMDRGLVTS
jgi:threonine/homoserine/homoserine lactone efflux protein